jgi:hypothetical protein
LYRIYKLVRRYILDVLVLASGALNMSEVVPQSALAGLMTEDQFAADIKKGVRTVRRYVARGLPVTRIGITAYIDPARARSWFEEGCPPPQKLRRRA